MNYPAHKNAHALPMLLLCLGSAACQPQADISILSPSNSEVVTTKTFDVVVAVSEDFTLDAQAVGGVNERDHGHIGLFLDTSKVATLTGESVTLDWNLLGVESGFHTLEAQLLNNDRTPLEPPVVAKVEFSTDLDEDRVTPTPTASPSPSNPETTSPPETPSPTEDSQSQPPTPTPSPSPSLNPSDAPEQTETPPPSPTQPGDTSTPSSSPTSGT